MILLHPYAQVLRNGLPNPKTPPEAWWRALLPHLGADIVQIGLEQELALVDDMRRGLSMKAIAALVRDCDYFLTVDSFLPHLAQHEDVRGVVIWSASDPLIFGYRENLNLLRDRRSLRKHQFAVWEEQTYDPEAFMAPDEVAVRIAEWMRSPMPSQAEMVNV
jgi:ADP-heptose:LPS heptosyltransferase